MERFIEPEAPEALVLKDEWGTEDTKDNGGKTNLCQNILLSVWESAESPNKIPKCIRIQCHQAVFSG